MKRFEFSQSKFLWVRTPVYVDDIEDDILHTSKRVNGHLYPFMSFPNIKSLSFYEEHEIEGKVICFNNEIFHEIIVEIITEGLIMSNFRLFVNDDNYRSLMPELERACGENDNVIGMRKETSDKEKEGIENTGSLAKTPFTGLFYCHIDKSATENGTTLLE